MACLLYMDLGSSEQLSSHRQGQPIQLSSPMAGHRFTYKVCTATNTRLLFTYTTVKILFHSDCYPETIMLHTLLHMVNNI